MSSLLLDTHVVLWANAAPSRLGQRTITELKTASEILISAVSVAEISIKRSFGKLTMSIPVRDLFEPLAAIELPLTCDHADALERLPLHHRDPFDRLLAAQALGDDLVLVTADERLLAYPIQALDARR